MQRTDFLIAGAGVIGLAIALELKRRHTAARILLIDKEQAPGLHASGRNSGVLHAGFYYSADSLKARFTRAGNAAWTDYCLTRRLPILRCGKLVVARSEAELPALAALEQRGRTNGVDVHLVTEQEARAIEPRARTVGQALWSPHTASVDPGAVLQALVADAGDAGIEIRCGSGYLRRHGSAIETGSGRVDCGYFVNAAGLHADRIARDFGHAREHRILPFKGRYLKLAADPGTLRTHLYPVPSARHPFLGVHWTVTVDGQVKIGPTALPAFWREHYSGLARFAPRDLIEIALLQARLLAGNGFGFAALAWDELNHASRRRMAARAGELVRDLDASSRFVPLRPGLRAQLVHVPSGTLEMDFRLEGDARSLHVLNAVSPAFTCALPFAAFVVDRIEALRA